MSPRCLAVKKEFVVYCRSRARRGIPVVVRRSSPKAARRVAEKLAAGMAKRSCEVSKILRRCKGA